MKIKINSVWLSAGGLEGPSELSVNGSQIVDSAALFRALEQKFFARGNRSMQITFTVSRTHESIKEAEVFVFTHYNDLPDEGDVFIYCGTDADQQIVTIQNAVLTAVGPRYKGVTTIFTYNIVGGIPRTDITPGGGEPDPDVTRRSVSAAATDDEELAITFSSPLTSTPVCVASMRIPDGGDVITCSVKAGSESASGFTVVFSAPIPGSGYEVSWIAIA